MDAKAHSLMLQNAAELIQFLDRKPVTKIEKTGHDDYEWYEVTATYRDRRGWLHVGMWRGRDLLHAMNRMRRRPEEPDVIVQRRFAHTVSP